MIGKSAVAARQIAGNRRIPPTYLMSWLIAINHATLPLRFEDVAILHSTKLSLHTILKAQSSLPCTEQPPAH